MICCSSSFLVYFVGLGVRLLFNYKINALHAVRGGGKPPPRLRLIPPGYGLAHKVYHSPSVLSMLELSVFGRGSTLTF